MFGKNIIVFISLESDFVLKKVCCSYVYQHLLRNLEKLDCQKVLIGDFPDYNYSHKIFRNLDLSCFLNDMSILNIISNSDAILILPANYLDCNISVIKKLLLYLEEYNTVIARYSGDDQYDITAINSSTIGKNFSMKNAKKNYVKVEITSKEVTLINSIKTLIQAEKDMQIQLKQGMIDNGIIMLDPDTTYLAFDSKIAPGVTIYPQVFIGKNVFIERDVVVFSFSHLEDVYIGNDCIIGPFARIRGEQAKVGQGSVIGNFAEIKNSKIANNVKIKHFCYIGDAEIKGNGNIGAGVVFCNYDGENKYKTIIDKNCFIGANSSLVAPLYVAENVRIGAGSTITLDIEEKGSLVLARAKQVIKKNINQ